MPKNGCEKTKMFVSNRNDHEALQNEINAWLEENYEKITIVERLQTTSDSQVLFTIVYKEKNIEPPV